MAQPSPSRSTTEHARLARLNARMSKATRITASLGASLTPVGLGLLALLLLGVARELPAQP